MHKIRKFISVILCVVLAASTLSACKSSENSADSTTISIVVTIFPEYDWAREILGDEAENVELTLLIGTGVDLHSFQPSVEDILKISTCDIFIYVGGESDEWAEDALAEAANDDMIVINLLEALGDDAKEEECVEGMEEEEEEDEDEDEVEYDEHVWLSLKNACIFCDEITEALAQVDKANADIYEENNAIYQAKLMALDEEYATACEEAELDTILFGDRFPFRYLVDDYGLSYYAAFSGCSAETEASFETIVFLAEKVDELGLGSVLIIETSDGKIAQTIVENTESKNQQILCLNSMQAVTTEDIEDGVTYLSMAEENLVVLKEALN